MGFMSRRKQESKIEHAEAEHIPGDRFFSGHDGTMMRLFTNEP